MSAKERTARLLGIREKILRIAAAYGDPPIAPAGTAYDEVLADVEEAVDALYLKQQTRRYSFLSGYALRNDGEEAEMWALREELAAAGIEPGWQEVPRRSARRLKKARKLKPAP